LKLHEKDIELEDKELEIKSLRKQLDAINQNWEE